MGGVLRDRVGLRPAELVAHLPFLLVHNLPGRPGRPGRPPRGLRRGLTPDPQGKICERHAAAAATAAATAAALGRGPCEGPEEAQFLRGVADGARKQAHRRGRARGPMANLDVFDVLEGCEKGTAAAVDKSITTSMTTAAVLAWRLVSFRGNARTLRNRSMAEASPCNA